MDSSTNGLFQNRLLTLVKNLSTWVMTRPILSSSTNARLIPLSSLTNAADTILGKALPLAAAFSDWRNFDIIHDHTRFYSTLFAHLLPIPVVSTVHHPIEFDDS